MTIETVRLKNDTPTRRRFYTPESWAHPAKGHLGIWAMMIERYSKPGDLILDPMGGSGATLLAALMGRDCILVELEEHFCVPMRASWAKMQAHGPMLGATMGQAVILRGDARTLPLVSADAILTSPPYANRLADTYVDDDPQRMSYQMGKSRLGADVALFSPPYEGSAAEGPSGIDWTKQADGREKQEPHGVGAHPWGYTRPPQVDAVVSSPPYEGSINDINNRASFIDGDKSTEWHPGPNSQLSQPQIYSQATENIGNQRGAAYWDSMRQVYAECWRVLRPGGIMALVLKGFTRNGAYVDLPQQTLDLLLAAGWVEHERWRRELWSLSFWRILQKRRDPAAFDDRLNYEEVIAVRKPGADGNGVAAVLTSPPYGDTAVTDLNTSTLNGPIGDNSRRQDNRKGGSEADLGFGSQGYTRPSAVIMSPPYEASVGDNKEGPSQTSVPGGWKAGTVNKHGGYTK